MKHSGFSVLLPSTFVPYKYSNTSTLWDTSLSNLIYLEQSWGHRRKQKHFCNWNGSKTVSVRVYIFSRQSRVRTARLRAVSGPLVKGLELEHLSGTRGSQCNHLCFQVIHKVNFRSICLKLKVKISILWKSLMIRKLVLEMGIYLSRTFFRMVLDIEKVSM